MKRLALIFILVLGVAGGLAASAASSGTDRIPVAGVIVGADEIAPGVGRTTGNEFDGTLALSDAQSRQYWAGDAYLEGTAVATFNYVSAWQCDQQLNCEVTGRLWGKITWEPYAFDGGWEGTFSFQITSFDEWGFSYSGKLEANGYGELEGSHLRLDVVTDATIPPWEGSHTAAGYVLMPGG